MIGTPQSRRRGFSAIELGVVVAMVLMLAGVVLPAVQQARQKQEKSKTANELRQTAIAVHNAEGAFRRMPPAYAPYGQMKTDATIHVHLLPFEDENDLYQNILKKGIKDFAAHKVEEYLSPDDPSNKEGKAKGVQNYAANLRVFSD